MSWNVHDQIKADAIANCYQALTHDSESCEFISGESAYIENAYEYGYCVIVECGCWLKLEDELICFSGYAFILRANSITSIDSMTVNIDDAGYVYCSDVQEGDLTLSLPIDYNDLTMWNYLMAAMSLMD